jgi:hypothetical protein
MACEAAAARCASVAEYDTRRGGLIGLGPGCSPVALHFHWRAGAALAAAATDSITVARASIFNITRILGLTTGGSLTADRRRDTLFPGEGRLQALRLQRGRRERLRPLMRPGLDPPVAYGERG